MSRRTITAHFTEPGEYLAELARDRALIERHLVRLTQTGRPDGTATITHVSVESSAIIDGRVCRLVSYCGALWGIRDTDEQVHRHATQQAHELEQQLLELGLEVRPGVWRDQ